MLLQLRGACHAGLKDLEERGGKKGKTGFSSAHETFGPGDLPLLGMNRKEEDNVSTPRHHGFSSLHTYIRIDELNKQTNREQGKKERGFSHLIKRLPKLKSYLFSEYINK